MSQAVDITPYTDGLYLGILVSTSLFGISISQAWTYANNNQDNWGLRSFVAVVILLDTANTCLAWQILRFYTMLHFGDWLLLLEITITTSWSAIVILSHTVSTATECFLASRIYLLNKKSLWAPILACLLAIGSLFLLIVSVHNVTVHPVLGQLMTDQIKISLGIVLSLTVCSVMLSTAVLVTRLGAVNTRVKKTSSMIRKLMLFFVTRGLLVSLNQIAYLIVYEVSPVSLHWLAFLLLLPKLYVITMMAILNSRQSSTASQSNSGVVMSFADSDT